MRLSQTIIWLHTITKVLPLATNLYLYTKCTSEWICNKKCENIENWISICVLVTFQCKRQWTTPCNKNNLKFVHCISKCKIKQYYFFYWNMYISTPNILSCNSCVLQQSTLYTLTIYIIHVLELLKKNPTNTCKQSTINKHVVFTDHNNFS